MFLIHLGKPLSYLRCLPSGNFFWFLSLFVLFSTFFNFRLTLSICFSFFSSSRLFSLLVSLRVDVFNFYFPFKGMWGSSLRTASLSSETALSVSASTGVRWVTSVLTGVMYALFLYSPPPFWFFLYVIGRKLCPDVAQYSGVEIYTRSDMISNRMTSKDECQSQRFG